MRILIVTTPLPTSQITNSLGPLVEQIRSLRALGIEIDVLEMTGRTPFKYLRGIWRLRHKLANADIDIVHGHHGYCGWVARAQFKHPVVVSFMGEDALGMSFRSPLYSTYYGVVAWMNRRLARWVNATIVKSAEMKQALQFDDAHVIPNGVNTAQFHPLKMTHCRADLGWDQDGLYVLFGANPDDPRKNFGLAQRAIEGAQEQLGQSITLVPLRGIAHTEVPLYMNACNAMIFTSLLEGSPNVVKEAMACNLPTVSVPVADVPWLFEDVQGYKVCAPDALSLADALTSLLAERLNKRSLAVNGADMLTRKKLTLQATARRVAHVYESVTFESMNHAES